MLMLAVIVIVSIIGWFFYASYSIGSNIYVKTYCKKQTVEKQVALTFDDGPHVEYTPRLLDVLNKYQVKATFFCIGEMAQKSPSLIQRMHKEGHLIGNHSYSHSSWFPLFGKKKMKADIHKGKLCMENLIGEKIIFFRPPFGVTNPTLKKALNSFSYHIIGWSIRSLDTQTKNVDKIFYRIVNRLSKGDVILLHDRLPHCAELTERLISYLQKHNYKIVRIDELFKL